MNSTVPGNKTRLQAIINHDKMAYRANDTIFVEILLIDTVTNGPFRFPTNSFNINDTFITVELGI